MDYQKHVTAAPMQSLGGVKALGVTGTTLGGLALLSSLAGGGGVVGNLLGGPRAFAAPAYAAPAYAAPAYAAPVAYAADGAVALAAPGCGCYVTEKEMKLIRENSEKDATIARMGAEQYASSVVAVTVAPLNQRICDLETASAVNAARDQDFRRYVEREFVHQPKASIRESLVVCKQCGCECEPRGCC